MLQFLALASNADAKSQGERLPEPPNSRRAPRNRHPWHVQGNVLLSKRPGRRFGGLAEGTFGPMPPVFIRHEEIGNSQVVLDVRDYKVIILWFSLMLVSGTPLAPLSSLSTSAKDTSLLCFAERSPLPALTPSVKLVPSKQSPPSPITWRWITSVASDLDSLEFPRS